MYVGYLYAGKWKHQDKGGREEDARKLAWKARWEGIREGFLGEVASKLGQVGGCPGNVTSLLLPHFQLRAAHV